MSKMEILEALPRLTVEERQEIRMRLAEIYGEEWLDDRRLTDAEKAEIERRVADLDRNPGASIPWAVAESRLTSRNEPPHRRPAACAERY